MKTIATRKLNRDTFSKTEKYLQQNGELVGENLYGHFLVLQADKDDEQVIDAVVHLEGSKISIKRIWIMEKNLKTGRLIPRTQDGERGSYAKILSEKYFNRFFEHLATVDIANTEQWQYTVTADLIEKIEAEIDRHIDPKRITEKEIKAYDRIEMILSVENALIYLCRALKEELGEEDLRVSYNKELMVFEIAFCSRKVGIRVPLGDIVREKWRTGESLAKATIQYVCGPLLMAAKNPNRMLYLAYGDGFNGVKR